MVNVMAIFGELERRVIGQTQSRRPTRTWGRKALSSAATATVAALIIATAGVIVRSSPGWTSRPFHRCCSSC
jgi:hypothetical protein